MAMYASSNSVVKTPMGLTERFPVEVGVHQGSVLSPLLFAVVMDEVVSSVRLGLPYEVLFADDLVLIATSKEELENRFTNWRRAMESKGMKVNVSKTKVMRSARDSEGVTESGKFPCGVCRRGVGTNSVLCTKCKKWTHARCSGLNGRITSEKAAVFVCKACTRGGHNTTLSNEVEFGGTRLGVVHSFSYLGDVVECCGGASAAVTARIRQAWAKWRELAPVLLNSATPRHLKGLLYRVCIRSAMTYASETWSLRTDDLRRLERTEMRMLRWLNNVKMADGKTNEEVRRMLDVDPIRQVLQRNRLRWFGHVERKKEDDGVKRAQNLVVDGRRPRGRPRKTWTDVVKSDMKERNMTRELAHDRTAWRAAVRSKQSNP